MKNSIINPPKNDVLKKPHHLIFEGAELTGKSYLMARVYDALEARYNTSKCILDGCHWFNTDVGIFGTKFGQKSIEKYVEILEILKEKNILFEKFHISDIVYSRLYRQKEILYKKTEDKLRKLNAKILLCTIHEDEKIIKKRISDRLKLYPHYKRILQSSKWYIRQQREYIKEIQKTALPYFIVDMTDIPNLRHKDILQWIGEI